MPLIIRLPVDPTRAAPGYARALNVLDRRQTAVQRQLRRAGIAGHRPAALAVLLALASRAPERAAFLDVGAGIGVHAAVLSTIWRDRGLRCVAIEPTPDTATVARAISRHNNLDVEVLEFAVSDTVGSRPLYLSNTSEASNSLNPAFRAAIGQLTVPVTTIDTQCASMGWRPFLMDVDVATHEPAVLAGAQRTIAESRPWIICQITGKTDKADAGRMLNRIEQLGYSFHALSGRPPWASCAAAEFRALRPYGTDWLLAPEPLTPDLLADVTAWLGAIAECDAQTNITTVAGQPLPPGWNLPHEVSGPTAGWLSRIRAACRLRRHETQPEDPQLVAMTGRLAACTRAVPAGIASDIVVLTDDWPVDTGNAFARHYAAATVHVLCTRPLQPEEADRLTGRVRVEVCPTVGRMRDYLVSARAVPHLIVETGRRDPTSRQQLLVGLFPHLVDGGVYAVDGVAGDELPGEDIANISQDGGRTFVTRRGTCHVMLPEGRATRTLNDRYGDGWGRVLVQRPPKQFISRATITTNRPDYDHRFRAAMEVPATVLREYRDVVCQPRQLVTMDGLVLPVSFHHPWARQLRNRATRTVGHGFARVAPVAPPTRLEGCYYHLDSEFPGHFGHVLTESLAKLWGWPDALARHPDLRVLLSVDRPGEDIKPFERAILHAFGIPGERIHVFDAPVRVDLLVGASQLFHNPLYVDPCIDQIWATIGHALRTPGPGRAARIFVPRAENLQRRCRNSSAVEELFTAHGFVTVYPERLSLGEQVDVFASAEVVAGYAGSALFNSIYSRPGGTRIVIAPDTYNASNEYLISSVKGDVVHHFWCDADVRHPEGGSSAAAFHSDFAFDFHRDGQNLEKVLKNL